MYMLEEGVEDFWEVGVLSLDWDLGLRIKNDELRLTTDEYLALAYSACDPWDADPAAMGLKAELWLKVGIERESSS